LDPSLGALLSTQYPGLFFGAIYALSGNLWLVGNGTWIDRLSPSPAYYHQPVFGVIFMALTGGRSMVYEPVGGWQKS